MKVATTYVPAVPTTGNSRHQHRLACLHLMSAGVVRREPSEKRLVTVHIVQHRRQQMDQDQLAASCRPLLAVLQRLGWIHSLEGVRLKAEQQLVKSNEWRRTEIEIEHVM